MHTILNSVLHPTDFSEGSKVAFFHALKAALVAKARLTLLNVSPDETASWEKFPGVRETLEKWGLLPSGSKKSDVAALGIDVRKAIAPDRDPIAAVVGFLAEHPADLIVLATQQRQGAMRWLSGSVAEPIARYAGESTLFVPGNSDGFVSAGDGSVSLNSILIPLARVPDAQPAVDAAVRLVKTLKCHHGVFTLVHAGSSDSLPAVETPDVAGWEWQTDLRNGDVIRSIVDASNDTAADLVVMTTDGRNGFLDGLRGSHSERVLRLAGMPLLTVPVGSLVYDVAG